MFISSITFNTSVGNSPVLVFDTIGGGAAGLWYVACVTLSMTRQHSYCSICFYMLAATPTEVCDN